MIEAFYRHSWNGNVRELDNVIKGAYAVCDDLEILPSDLPTKFDFKDENEPEEKIPQTAPPPERTGKPREGTLEAVQRAGSMKEFLKNQEKELIMAAYERFHTVRKASAYLGMSMPTYVRKRRKYLG